jgi:hypothetical protein
MAVGKIEDRRRASTSPGAERVKPNSKIEQAPAADDRAIIDAVYAPVRPIVQSGSVIAVFEMRDSSSGPPYLPVFSTEEQLVHQLGDLQTRIEVSFRFLVENFGVEYLEIDPDIEPVDWRWSPETVAQYKRKISQELRNHD